MVAFCSVSAKAKLRVISIRLTPETHSGAHMRFGHSRDMERAWGAHMVRYIKGRQLMHTAERAGCGCSLCWADATQRPPLAPGAASNRSENGASFVHLNLCLAC